MRKPKTLGRSMMCPFRIEEHFKYANMDDKVIVCEAHTKRYGKCYGRKCPMYKWDADERDYIGTKVQLLELEGFDNLEI